jgi:hypothetical protein
MYELLLAVAVVVFGILKTRERFRASVGVRSHFHPDEKGTVKGYVPWATTSETTTAGQELVSTWPSNTCCPETPELVGGLCYVPCRDGYTGDAGPTCRAISVSVGVGRPVGLEPCPAGWNNDGLTCREPLRCGKGWKFFTEGCSGGKIRGRLNSGGICDWPSDRGNLPSWLVDKRDPKNYVATHPERVDGLCYRRCPSDYPLRIPGMPYLCYKGGPLVYGRGAGKIPKLARVFGECWSPF